MYCTCCAAIVTGPLPLPQPTVLGCNIDILMLKDDGTPLVELHAPLLGPNGAKIACVETPVPYNVYITLVHNGC